MLTEIHKILQDFGEKAVEWLKDEHIKAGQKASGKTLESFKFELEENDGTYRLKILGAEHVEYLERGRGPGKLPSNWHSIINQWINDKGIASKFASQSQRNSFIYLLGRKVKEQGNYQYRTGRTFSGSQKPISEALRDEKMKELNKALNFYITKRITSEIINQYKDGDTTDN